MRLRVVWAPVAAGLIACSPQADREAQGNEVMAYFECDNPSRKDRIFRMMRDGESFHYEVWDRGKLVQEGDVSARHMDVVEEMKKRMRSQVCDDTASRHSVTRLIERYEGAEPAR